MKIPNSQYIKSEIERIEHMKKYENEAYSLGITKIAGVDEVGRGCLAGPVVAAAVILPRDFFIPGINDSKKLTAAKRNELASYIKTEAISWSIAYISPEWVDKFNVLNATKMAMKSAINQLAVSPEYIMFDAIRLDDIGVEQLSLVKGDSLSISIAAASIIAKVDRDRSMELYDDLYPGYGFAKHKGYGTKAHIEAIIKNGPCPIHRASFEPIKSLKLLPDSLFKQEGSL